MNDFILIVISYCLVILMGFGLLQFLTAGFLFTYLRVRASRGKKCLVMVRGVTTDFYRSGVIEEGFLVYKRSRKVSKRMKCQKEAVFRTMGINAVQVDDEMNAVVLPDFSAITGYDPVKYENLYIRALTAPELADNREKIILILLIVLVVAVIVLGFLVFKTGVKVDELVAVLPSQVL